MQKILAKKILLKDITTTQIIVLFVFLLLLPYFFNLKIDLQSITGLEQTLFVILFAILFVFHDSIVGYKTITKIKNTLNKLSERNIRESVLNEIGAEHEIVYNEFLEQTKNQINRFNKVVYRFKRTSYKLYLVFSFFGLLSLMMLLISKESFIIDQIINTISVDKVSFLVMAKYYIVDLSIMTQVALIPLWIISAVQAEQQKSLLLNYLDGSNIILNVNKYIKVKNEVNVANSLFANIV